MKNLNNNKEDIQFLNDLLKKGIKPKAKIKMGIFTDQTNVFSFTTIEMFGIIIYIDLINGCCYWTSKGQKMPCVNINCITLLEKY